MGSGFEGGKLKSEKKVESVIEEKVCVGNREGQLR